MYVVTEIHGEEHHTSDYEDHNVFDIKDDVVSTLDKLLSGDIEFFTVQWIRD